MTSIKTARTAEGRKGFIVSGAALLVVGAAGIVTVALILTLVPDDGVNAQARGLAQSLGILITALAIGGGLLLLTVARIKHPRPPHTRGNERGHA